MKSIKYILFIFSICFISITVAFASECNLNTIRVCQYDKFTIKIDKNGKVIGSIVDSSGGQERKYQVNVNEDDFKDICPTEIWVLEVNDGDVNSEINYKVQIENESSYSGYQKYSIDDKNTCEYQAPSDGIVCNYIDYQIEIVNGEVSASYIGNDNENYIVKIIGEFTACADTVYISIPASVEEGVAVHISKDFKANYNIYKLNIGKTGVSGHQNSGSDNAKGIESNIVQDFDTSKGCTSYLGNPKDSVNKPPAYYLQFVFNLMKYIAIILLFVLTIIDFAKATATSDQDALKKALQKAVKRLIIAVVIFLLPILISFLFKILGIYSAGNCGIK